MSIKIPDGWKSKETKDFAVELKPGKPPEATSWFDVKGRTVVKSGNTWKLQRQKPAPPRKLSPQEIEGKRNEQSRPAQKPKPAPPRKLSPEEIEKKEGGRSEQAQKPESDSKKTTNLSPEEQARYNKFADIARESGLKEATRKSFYPDPEQAQKDEENRKRMYAPYLALSEDQLSAIGAYTSEWDLNMNSFLRTGKIEQSTGQLFSKAEPVNEAMVKKAIEDLTSALEQLPDAPEGTYHRAVSGFNWKEDKTGVEASEFMKQLQSLEPGDVLEDPGFSSFTSAGAPVVDRFLKGDSNSDQNLVFEVKSSKMKDISPISKYKQEKEHMLPPGAKFRVIGKRQHWSRKAGNHTVLTIEQI